MRALTYTPAPSPKDLPTLQLSEVSDPRPAAGEVLVRVQACALNRADLLQIRGLYPPPPGESEVPGLECAGEIMALGEGSTDAGWKVGDRVMVLLAGGGQAELVAVPVGQLLRVPSELSLVEAAALPEVALTAWTNLVAEGGLEAGQSVLITAAASGVGTFAVQLARELGARVLVAGRHPERLERLRAFGADHIFQLGDTLPAAVRAATDGRGVDLVIELAGGVGVASSLAALADGGRLVLVGVLAGRWAEIDLGEVLLRRLRLVGSVLRPRPREEKAQLVADFMGFAAERLADGRLKPVVDRILPFDEIAAAYGALEGGGVFGKIVLEIRRQR